MSGTISLDKNLRKVVSAGYFIADALFENRFKKGSNALF